MLYKEGVKEAGQFKIVCFIGQNHPDSYKLQNAISNNVENNY